MEVAYFDNAATTALCAEAVKAVCDTAGVYGNPSSLHSLGTHSAVLIENAREAVAKSIKADKAEIYFTSGGTEADNTAVLGAARALRRRGNRIVTTAFEHSAVMNSMKQLEAEGFEVVYLKPDDSGTVPIKSFLNAVNSDTILVSCMSVNNETGAFLPIEMIKKCITKAESPALFHCDATQSYLKYPLNVQKIDADLVTISAHKIHGPKGVGALYVKKGVHILPHSFGGEQEKGFRPGTEPLILIAGFGEAVKAYGDSNGAIQTVKPIKDMIKSALGGKFDDIVINSPENSSDFILNLSVIGVRSETMLHFLEEKGVFVSSGSACSKGKASHVMSALGFDRRRADSAVRISLSKFNTPQQAKLLIDGIIEAKNSLIKSK